MLESSIVESGMGVLADGFHAGVNWVDSGVHILADGLHGGVLGALELICKEFGGLSAAFDMKYSSSARNDL